MRKLITALVLGVMLLGTPASAAVSARSVEVLDLADDLSQADEQLLIDRTPEVDLPAEVTDVTYVLFPDNDDNLNDTVRHFGENERRDLISEAGDKFAPGALIVAVGLDPRRMGVYCGDDVCDAIGFYSPGRQDGILDRMEQPLRDGNWAAGMLEGTRAAADPGAVRETSDGPGVIGWIIGAVIAGIGLIAGVFVWLGTRRSKAKKAREQFDVIQRDYGRVAQDLQAIDVRAHSLTSPLANDQLRGQWEEVKSGFLGLNDTFGELDGLSASSPDKDFRRHHQAIGVAHEQVTRLQTAEGNIETLARMEHGDQEIRRRELTDMHEDVLAAAAAVDDESLRHRLERIDARILDLRARLDDPRFMDTFADLITDTRIILQAAQDRMYAESDVEKDDDHRAPAVWESTWRPGYGYGNYVPYGMIHTWHSADVQAASSSSSATTGYSSGGFSGGGASRGF